MNDSQSRGEWTSASSAAADALCQWRHTMQRGCPEVESDDAAFGERIHAALAKDDPAGLTPEEVDVFDSCVKIRERKLKEFFGSDAGEAIKFTEKRYWLTVRDVNQLDIADHSGQADCVYRLGNRLAVFDYKCLPGKKADSSENPQLRDLAVLCWLHFIGVTEIGVCLIQPFVTHNPTICVYGPKDLQRSLSELEVRVICSNEPKGQPTPGEAQCEFCRAKGKCPQYQQWASEGLPVARNLVDVPRESWTPEQRRAFADNFDRAQKWLNESWAFLEVGAKSDPNFLPGYGWKDGATMKTQQTHCLRLSEPAKDAPPAPQQVFDRLAVRGMTLPEFFRCIGVVHAQVKLWVAAKTGLKGLKLDAALDDLYAGLVTTAQNKPSLKPIKETKELKQ